MMYRLIFWHFIVHIKLRLILLMENWIKSLWFMRKVALRVNYHEVSSMCDKLIVIISFTKSKADMIQYLNLGNAQTIAMLFLWLLGSGTVRMLDVQSWGLEQWDVMTFDTLVVKSEYGKISWINGKLHGIVQEFALRHLLFNDIHRVSPNPSIALTRTYIYTSCWTQLLKGVPLVPISVCIKAIIYFNTSRPSRNGRRFPDDI